MKQVLIPVLLSALVGPGVGQLYNRQTKKGGILIGLALLVLIAFSVWLSRAALPYLPPLTQNVEPQVLRDVIETHIVKEHPVSFYGYQLILACLWAYGVVDAYRVGRKRLLNPTAVPTHP